MAKRRFGIIVLFLCFCLSVLSGKAQAAFTTEAKEPISVDQACSLTVSYGYEDTVFPDLAVTLYQVADVSADFRYTLTAPFAATGLILNDIQTQGEWNEIRFTLETQILADKIAPTAQVETNPSGRAIFPQLSPGLYLVSAVEAELDNMSYLFDGTLIALPGLGTDGLWQYQVAAAAKPQVLPPIEPDEDIQLKILKLWKGDEGRVDRPQHINIEIFRDGVSYEIVTLSAENNWSYAWSVRDDGADWKVIERDVPDGYVMTVQQRDGTFVITNTRPGGEIPPPPQTGDTSNMLLYAILLYASGTMLILLGLLGKRKRYEKTN